MSLPVSAPGSAATSFTLQESAGPVPVVSAHLPRPDQHAAAQSSVSLTTGDEPLALVFKTAVDGMNEALGGRTSTAVIAQDANPVVTSARIVAMSVAFYQAFRLKHLGEDESVVLEQFMKAIHRGIEHGFGEAREVLQGLHAFDAPTAATVDLTYHLVQQGLAEFAAHPPQQEALAA